MNKILFVIAYGTLQLLILIVSFIIASVIPLLSAHIIVKIYMYMALVVVWIGEIEITKEVINEYRKRSKVIKDK